MIQLARIQIASQRRYHDRVLHDPGVTIALFENTQYIARQGRRRAELSIGSGRPAHFVDIGD